MTPFDDLVCLPPVTLAVHRTGPTLTHHEAGPLCHDLLALIATRPFGVVVDLSATEVLDAAALGALSTARLAARDLRVTLVLVAPHPAVRGVLESARLHSRIPVFASLDDATFALDPVFSVSPASEDADSGA